MVASSIERPTTDGTSSPCRLTAEPEAPVPATRPSTAVRVFVSDGGSGRNHPLGDRVAVLSRANPSRTDRPGVPETSSCTTTGGRPGAHAVVVRRSSPSTEVDRTTQSGRHTTSTVPPYERASRPSTYSCPVMVSPCEYGGKFTLRIAITSWSTCAVPRKFVSPGGLNMSSYV